MRSHDAHAEEISAMKEQSKYVACCKCMRIHHVDIGCNEALRVDVVPLIARTCPATHPKAEHKYNRPIVGMDGTKTTVDVYRVLSAFRVVEPEIQHSIKKLLNPGIRDKGSFEQDISEAILSLQKLQTRMEQEK